MKRGISDKGVQRIASRVYGQASGGGSPRVYVGTYGKYSGGSITGEWVDLDDFSSAEEFYEYLRELHKDESDPEFMFQDWENVPSWAISESWIDPRYFTLLETVDEHEQEAFSAYLAYFYSGGLDQNKDIDALYDDFRDLYSGEYASFEDYAYALVEDLGFEGLGENILFYFDEERFVRDLGYDGWSEVDEEDAADSPEDYPEGPGVYNPYGELYTGYDTLEAVVDAWLDEGDIGAETIQRYFDYEKFARDLEHDYVEQDGHFFSRG